MKEIFKKLFFKKSPYKDYNVSSDVIVNDRQILHSLLCDVRRRLEVCFMDMHKIECYLHRRYICTKKFSSDMGKDEKSELCLYVSEYDVNALKNIIQTHEERLEHFKSLVELMVSKLRG